MYIDLHALTSTPVQSDPFPHVVVPQFVVPRQLRSVIRAFPKVPGPGSHPPSELEITGAFEGLMAELLDEPFRKAVELKFNVDLRNRPVMYTVRGSVRAKDGAIHTDSESKIITVLLYLNEGWEPNEGRLRLLRNGSDLEDYAAEVPPCDGNLIIFVRSERSWHGHYPFEGERKAIQLNWVTSQDVVNREQARHKLSTRIKKFANFFDRRSA
jgi:SM-20-related protein